MLLLTVLQRVYDAYHLECAIDGDAEKLMIYRWRAMVIRELKFGFRVRGTRVLSEGHFAPALHPCACQAELTTRRSCSRWTIRNCLCPIWSHPIETVYG